MKRLCIFAVSLLASLIASAQIGYNRMSIGPSQGADAGWAETSAAYAAAARIEAARRAKELAIQTAKADASRAAWLEHPLRVIDGKLYDLSSAIMDKYEHDFNKYYEGDPTWFEVYHVTGKVMSVTGAGVIVVSENARETVFLKNLNAPTSGIFDGVEVDCFAIHRGIYQYTAVNNAAKTVPSFDCGRLFDDKADHFETMEKASSDGFFITKYISAADQILARQRLLKLQETRVAQEKATKETAVIKFSLEQANNGSAYYQFKMGMRYLSGDGVDKDPTKAQDFLAKSAAQGNEDATKQITKFSAQK